MVLYDYKFCAMCFDRGTLYKQSLGICFCIKGAVAPKTAYALWQGFMLCMESLPYFFE